jgi:hypothetical protein
MNIQVTIPVSTQTIVDTFNTAIEVGSGYWLSEIDWGHIGKIAENRQERYEYLGNAIEDDDDQWKLHLTDDEGKRHIMNQDKLWLGMHLMARDYPRHFDDMINDNGDAITADIFLQCVLLGDIVYG